MYFLRVDDLISDMDKKLFENIITFFDDINIKPLLAVIPHTKKQDHKFWSRLKELQDQGWTIGLHGYNHKLNKNSKGTESIIPIQNYSEFVGLDYKDQNQKISDGLKIFKKYGIKTNIFVAPAHGQDKNTLKALQNNKIKNISDGFFLFPQKIDNTIFYPQQLWQYRFIPFGVKTICLHLGDFKNLNNKVLSKIRKNKQKFDNYDAIFSFKKENILKNLINYVFNKVWFLILTIMRKG